jgi:hypothetical protein
MTIESNITTIVAFDVQSKTAVDLTALRLAIEAAIPNCIAVRIDYGKIEENDNVSDYLPLDFSID